MSNHLPAGTNPDDPYDDDETADYEAEQEEAAWNPDDPIQDFDEDTKVIFNDDEE